MAASVSWPSFMPSPRSTYSFGVMNNIARTGLMDIAQKQRRRDSVSIHRVNTSWFFDDNEFGYFNGWFKLILKNGAIPFNIDLAFGDGIKTVVARFVNASYSANHTGKLDWVVTAGIEVEYDGDLY